MNQVVPYFGKVVPDLTEVVPDFNTIRPKFRLTDNFCYPPRTKFNRPRMHCTFVTRSWWNFHRHKIFIPPSYPNKPWQMVAAIFSEIIPPSHRNSKINKWGGKYFAQRWRVTAKRCMFKWVWPVLLFSTHWGIPGLYKVKFEYFCAHPSTSGLVYTVTSTPPTAVNSPLSPFSFHWKNLDQTQPVATRATRHTRSPPINRLTFTPHSLPPSTTTPQNIGTGNIGISPSPPGFM